ncbi:MAG: NADP-dependent phosphogluconate dehydrogenase [Candidatus Geothermarchaeales archaeon]
MERCEIGLVGLGVMGRSLALNIAEKGFSVAVFNRTTQTTKEFARDLPDSLQLIPTYTMQQLTDRLEEPRRILLMVSAGPAVDRVLGQLGGYLSRGDLVIDGGNSHFRDTERRGSELAERGVMYLGLGVSGGEEGARKGPCLMAGGEEAAYSLVKGILTTIAAQVEDGPCCALLGPRGAGHFVKMVHNGIEYAVMQVIAEAYDILSTGLGLEIEEIGEVFAEWSRTELSSYLMEITAEVLRKRDSDTGRPLVSVILDAADQKGTGRWTSQTAMDLGIPIPTIDAAVSARILSSQRGLRDEASRLLRGARGILQEDGDEFVEELRNAVACSIITAYAQGMSILGVASDKHRYDIELAEVARIWRGGCIIRAEILQRVREAFLNNPSLGHLFLEESFAEVLSEKQDNWRHVVTKAKAVGIPTPAMGASLDYFDGYRRDVLPANLIQGLRDRFGAHGYRRVDRPGEFSTYW